MWDPGATLWDPGATAAPPPAWLEERQAWEAEKAQYDAERAAWARERELFDAEKARFEEERAAFVRRRFEEERSAFVRDSNPHGAGDLASKVAYVEHYRAEPMPSPPVPHSTSPHTAPRRAPGAMTRRRQRRRRAPEDSPAWVGPLDDPPPRAPGGADLLARYPPPPPLPVAPKDAGEPGFSRGADELAESSAPDGWAGGLGEFSPPRQPRDPSPPRGGSPPSYLRKPEKLRRAPPDLPRPPRPSPFGPPGLGGAYEQEAQQTAPSRLPALRGQGSARLPPIEGRARSQEPSDIKKKHRSLSLPDALPVENRKPAPFEHHKQQSDNDEGGSRQMYDKRTLRVKRREVFERGISNFTPAAMAPLLEDAGVSVYVRKRPLFEKERGEGEFDAITVHGKSLVVAHTASFQADLRTPFMTHHHWPFDHVFDDHAHNDDVYSEVVTPLMEIFRQNRPATVFMYGQTGSGKTHTIRAIMEKLVEEMFQYAESVDVECFEIAGKKVVDLPSRAELQLREVKHGKQSVLHVGAARERVSTANALLTHMLAAQRRRATQKTQANNGSSRSHFCVRIYCADAVPFTLVDLAGTERRKDSDAHSKERQLEGAEINSSLHALKECIRAQGKQWAPYRNSPLTRVLQESLAASGHAAKLAVIATVSPCGTDIEHSLSTLQVAYMLSGRPNDLLHVGTTDPDQLVAPPQRILHPTQFSHEVLVEWIASLGSKFSNAAHSVPQSVDGKAVSRWNVQRFAQHCDDAKLGEALASAWQDLLKKAADVQKRERAKKKNW